VATFGRVDELPEASRPEGLHGGDEEPEADEEYGRGARAARVARQKEYEAEQQQYGRGRA